METPKRGLGVSPALRMALLLILAGAFLLAGKAAAHDWPGGHAWDTSITTETSNGNTSYATQIQSAASDYTNNTDLPVSYCTEPCIENIRQVEEDYGPTNWDAYAYWYGNPEYRGKVKWNSYYNPKANIVVHRLARHEMGHIFGLDHPPCPGDPGGVASIMGCPRDGEHDLHTHDRDDMNVKY